MMRAYPEGSGNWEGFKKLLLKIWGATVKVASRKRQQPLLHQLIQLLYPSEVHSQQEAPVDAVSDESQNLESVY